LFKNTKIPAFFKTVAGILAIAVIISGIMIYFARQQKKIFYHFRS